MSGSSMYLRRRPRELWRLAGVLLLVAASALALADDKAPPAPAASATATHPLDLSAPPLRLVMTPEQIASLTTEQDDDTPTEDVTIKQDAYEAPIPVGTFRALPWALMHPLQAWKIVMPIPND